MNIEKRKGLKITAQTCQAFFEEIKVTLRNDKYDGDFFSRCLKEERVAPQLQMFKSTVSFGRCGRGRKSGEVVYTVKVNEIFFSAPLNTEWGLLRNTLVHEIVHTLPECFNHGDSFQMWAARLNHRYGLDISTREDEEGSRKFEDAQFPTIKNIMACPVCGEYFLYSKTTQYVRRAALGQKVYSCGCQKGVPNKHYLWVVRYNGKDLLEPICPISDAGMRDEWVKKHVPEGAQEGDFVWTPERLKKEYWWKDDKANHDSIPAVEPLVLTIEEPEEYVALLKEQRRKKRQQGRKKIPVEQLSLF